MRLRRTYLATGALMLDHVKTLREAEQRVAWCATDNLLMTRSAASAEAVQAGAAFKAGEPFVLNGQYRFEIVTESGAAS